MFGAAVAAALVACGAAATPAAGQAPLRFPEAELFIEINATDGDAGLQMRVGGEEWERLRLIDPRRRTIMDIRARGSLDGYGLTDLGFESAEPPFTRLPFRRFRARFPAGRYRFVGTAVNGRRIVASDRLTHVVPDGPRVTAPARNAVIDPAAPTIQWQPVTTPRGIRIVRHEVILTAQGDGPNLTIRLGGAATSVAIPPGLLPRGAEYALEVIARASNGNQTITEVPFRTAP